MNNKLLQGFTKGIPDKPGCYVLICEGLDGLCEFIVADVIEVTEEDVKSEYFGDDYAPGLYVIPDPEGCAMYEIEDAEIVAYKFLPGVSAIKVFYFPEECGLIPKREPRRTMTPAEAQGILTECLKRNRNR